MTTSRSLGIETWPNQGMQATRYPRAWMPGVDMTSDVKGWEQLFRVRIIIFPFVYRKSRSQ
jgi:hypothetical protein